jgi:opacity protein-like surface antigen
MRRLPLTILLAAAAAPAAAQEGWDYTATVSGWFSGLASEVGTPFGEVEAELDFADVWDALNLAFFGSFEARTGRWALVTDLVFADLGSEEETPFGVAFRSAEVDTRLTLFSAYAAYSVVDDPGLRVDLGAGFRYADAKVDVQLQGNAAPTTSLSYSDSWVDPLIGARARFDLSETWFGNVSADIGGFGLENASDLTWQAYAGVGYRFNETWAMQAGYRHISIDRAFDGADVTLDVSGPIVGIQASF